MCVFIYKRVNLYLHLCCTPLCCHVVPLSYLLAHEMRPNSQRRRARGRRSNWRMRCDFLPRPFVLIKMSFINWGREIIPFCCVQRPPQSTTGSAHHADVSLGVGDYILSERTYVMEHQCAKFSYAFQPYLWTPNNKSILQFIYSRSFKSQHGSNFGAGQCKFWVQHIGRLFKICLWVWLCYITIPL